MQFIDFFAGVGGFRSGLELAGHKCVGFCEWDKYATASYTSMHLITESQREYLSTLTLKKRQKEILKDEYRNGEWYSNDIRNVDAGSLPTADCWCFGAPCQDFSIVGKRAGLDGDRSSLIREIFRLLEEQKGQDRPEWLIYENVKGMLSSNRGLDYLSILSEMDRLGYDIEWQNINSKWFVPQNRERIYTIGHLRRFGRAKILPVTGTDGENSICQIGMRQSDRKNPNAYRVYDKDGIAPALGTMQGGGREPSIGVKVLGNTNPCNRGMNGNIYDSQFLSPSLTTNKGEGNKIAIKIIGEVNSSQDGQVHDISGIAKCHSAGHNNSPKVAIPVLTPDRAKKRQNGRRFKENGEPMFSLTAQDRHGVAIEPIVMSGNVVSESENICKCLNANDQRKVFGAKQERTMVSIRMNKPIGIVGGLQEHQTIREDGISPSLTSAMGMGGGQTPCVFLEQSVKPKQGDGIYVEMPEGFIVYAIWYEKEQCYITIRKLTPKECFRLQGWTDDYFERAAFVNSDSQLYKQAGNGVTVDVVQTIGERIKKVEEMV